MTDPIALAQLRHLYQNMVNGAVRDTASAKRMAEGLLALAIEVLERDTPPAVAREPVPISEAIERMAADRYKVVPSHESMFHRWAVVAGTGTQQLYLGREVECQNMARKFAGAFLDGAFVAMAQAAPQPAPAYVAGPSDSEIDSLVASIGPTEGIRRDSRDLSMDKLRVLVRRALATWGHVKVAPAAQGDAEDTARLDWLTFNISGKALRDIGVVWSEHGDARRAIDAARSQDKQGANHD